MQPFLSIVAQDLHDRLDGHYEHLTVVCPNKRARLFLNQHLLRLAGGRPFWSPRYATISELFRSLSDLTVADPIFLVCKLYEAYVASLDGVADQTLDEFYAWGELMLSDFDDIDNNLVDARALFANLVDRDALTSFDYLDEVQREAINKYFQNFHPEADSALQRQCLSFWQRLMPIYTALRHALAAAHLAYDGMLKRDVTERLARGAARVDGTRVFAFVGFNVLSRSELRFFSQIKEQASDTLFYWDCDRDFLADTSRACHFIKQNIDTLGTALPIDSGTAERTAQQPEIHFLGSSTENAQARYAGRWIEERLKSTPGVPLTRTAVVLCDEHLLQPVLHSLPARLPLNVTMGFPLQQTPVSSFLAALLDHYHHNARSPRSFRLAPTLRLLQHPYTRRMAGQAALDKVREIRDQKILFPSPALFADDDCLQALFTLPADNGQTLRHLISLVRRLGDTYRDEGTRPTADFDTQLAAESVFRVHAILTRLLSIHDTGLLDISYETLARLIRALVRECTIPFHGEPAIGVQVMGVLETRNLDFDNLLLLSTNEGNMPKKTQRTSFVPYNLREAFGMTSVEWQTSLYAYNFHRLLRRARHVTLAYNNATDSVNHAGEMSSFMLQLLLSSTGCQIGRHNLVAARGDRAVLHAAPPTVEKTDEVMRRLRSRFTAPDEFLSPSAINDFLDCPLRFYLKQVARLRPEDEMKDSIESNVFGLIFHYAMQHVYNDLSQRAADIQAPTLLQIADDEALVGRYVDCGFNKEFFKIDETRPDFAVQRQYNGEQALNRHVLIGYVSDQLRFDAALCPLRVLETETDKHVLCHTLADGTKVRLGGIIDRIDRITVNGERHLRIVDYKTSSKEQSANGMDEVFAKPKNRPGYYFQTFYYAHVCTSPEAENPIREPVGMSLAYCKHARSLKDKAAENAFLPFTFKYGKSKPVKVQLIDFSSQCAAEFEPRLNDTINRIFDRARPFTPTDETDNCTYCDFNVLCGRCPEKKAY